jgi:hypothetical protein
VIPALVAAVLVLAVLALSIEAAHATAGRRDPDDLQPPCYAVDDVDQVIERQVVRRHRRPGP